jgi:hypothetical protein
MRAARSMDLEVGSRCCEELASVRYQGWLCNACKEVVGELAQARIAACNHSRRHTWSQAARTALQDAADCLQSLCGMQSKLRTRRLCMTCAHPDTLHECSPQNQLTRWHSICRLHKPPALQATTLAVIKRHTMPGTTVTCYCPCAGLPRCFQTCTAPSQPHDAAPPSGGRPVCATECHCQAACKLAATGLQESCHSVSSLLVVLLRARALREEDLALGHPGTAYILQGRS